MATPVPLSDILDPEKYADGQIINCIKGKVISVFQAKSGTGANGAWEFQDVILEQGGKQVKLSFAKCSQPQSAKGQMIMIESVKSTAHGLQGIKIEDRSFTQGDEEKHERRIKITSSAKITYVSPTSAAGSGKSDTVLKKEGPAVHPLLQIRDNIILHRTIRVEVKDVYTTDAEHEPNKILVTESELQSAVASVFIEACKQGLAYGFIDRVAKPIPPKILPPPSDPADWAKCQMPAGEYAGKTLAELPDDKLLELYSFANDAKKEGPFWACARRAAKERNVIPPEEEPQRDPDLDLAEDDIPF